MTNAADSEPQSQNQPAAELGAGENGRSILICQNVHCYRNRSGAVLAAFQSAALPAGVTVTASDCHGQCHLGPSVRIVPDETWYARVEPADVSRIVEEHLRQNHPVSDLLNPRLHMDYSAYYGQASYGQTGAAS